MKRNPVNMTRFFSQSHGNGGGMALADIVSKKFFDALDLQLTQRWLGTLLHERGPDVFRMKGVPAV